MLKSLEKSIVSLFGENSNYGVNIDVPSRSYTNEMLETHSIGDFLPYVSFDENNNIFFNKNSHGFVIESLPLIGSSSEIENQLNALFKNTLPLGSNVQFLLIASPKIGKWLDTWQEPRLNKGGVYAEIAKKRKEYFDTMILGSKNDKNLNRIRTYRLVMSYSKSGNNPDPLEIKETIDLIEQVSTVFNSLGLPTITWGASDLIRTLDDILNVNENSAPSTIDWNPYQDISSQIMAGDTHTILGNKGFIQNEGEFEIRSYTNRNHPEGWYQGAMASMIGDAFNDFLKISCPFIIHYGVHMCDDKTLKTALLAKGTRIELQAESTLGKWIPALRREAREYDVLRQLLERNEKLVRTRYQVMLIAKKDQINKAEQLLHSLYKTHKWGLISDRFIQFPSLLSLMPMSWGEGFADDNAYFYKRAKTTASHEPPNLIPMQGEWQGTKTPGMLLVGRNGQICYFNPFDNMSGNYNVNVVGKSGSGKSVGMQEISLSLLGLGGRVFVLDKGRSFEKLAGFLGGKFVEFSANAKISINPFSTINNLSEEAIDDALSCLKPIISLMAAPSKGTDDKESAIIEKALREVWNNKGNEAGIDDLACWLESQSDQRAKDIGSMLYPYTLKGAYGRFFNGPATLTFDEKFIVIEFESLQERKDLSVVVFQMVQIQIINQMFAKRDSGEFFAIVSDESADRLKHPVISASYDLNGRTVRKYNGSLITGTQSIKDFHVNDAAQAVFDNADWVIFLSQKKESIDFLKQTEKISMDAHMERQLKSLSTKQGEYAEMMIYGSNGYAVTRLLLDPFSKILYTSKPDEYSAVKQLQAKGFSLVEAINLVAKNIYGEKACE